MINPNHELPSGPAVGEPITIRGVVDLAEIVPYVLGFQPNHSLVALLLDFPPGATGTLSPTRQWLSLAARVDLGLWDTSSIGGALDIRIREHDAVALLAFTDDAAAGGVLLRLLTQQWTDKTICAAVVTASEVFDVITEAKQSRVGESTGRVAAEAVGRGLVISHPSREQLAATIWPHQHVTLDRAVRARLADKSSVPHEVHVTYLRTRLARATTDPYLPMDDEDAVLLLAGVQDTQVRDRLWSTMTQNNASGHVQVWAGLARRLDTDLCLPVLGLLGFAGWIQGDGALANIALERAQLMSCDHTDSMLGLLAQILDAAIPPDAWSRVSAQSDQLAVD